MLEFFSQKTPIYVFATRRKINEFYLTCAQGFLPTAMSADEFFSSIVIVPHRKKIPKSIRKIFLLQIIAQISHPEKLLVFEKSFLGYLESSSFLFSFFDELAVFGINPRNIPLKDTYGDYEEHLEILIEIYEKYIQKLDDCHYYDHIITDDYEILEEFFTQFSSVEFYLDGFLKTHEKNILEKIAQILPLFVHIECDRYNKDHFSFAKIPFEQNYRYKINLKNHEIIAQESLGEMGKIEVFSFASRISQAALVFERVNEWLEMGIDPKKLAIILPDEGFAKYLKLLDTYNNLNFAMGKSIENLVFIQELKALLLKLKEDKPFRSKDPLAWLEEVVNDLLQANHSESKILERFHSEIMFEYQKIYQEFQEFSNAEILELYLLDLNRFRIDDVYGGKIKVMGVLESRGLSFDRVVIVDFNEGFVPSLKESDIFLNTQIRKSLQMATLKDKQDLQKHYYLQILQNTQKIDIAFVQTDELNRSKMLDELDLTQEIQNGDEKYRIFPFNEEKTYKEESFKGIIPKDFIFSASKINTFFSCKRKFFYSYIERLTPPKETSGTLSSIIHHYLKESYQNFIHKPIEMKLIKDDFFTKIYQTNNLSPKEKLELEYNAKILEKFWKNESKRIQEDGIAVLECEKEFHTKIAGFTFNGRIDRIDKTKNEEILLIDYKLKSEVKIQTDLESISDYQLAIYAYGAKSLGYGENFRGFFYNLKEGKLQEDPLLEEKKNLLEKNLEIFHQEIDFEKTQDIKNCKFCPFVDICGISTD